jgi:hypothetical protein
MAEFIECTVPVCTYRGRGLPNEPVNLARCTALSRTVVRWYPNNEGLPAIHFKGCDETWAFPTAAEREAEWARIIAYGRTGD